jgi:hypothetical protein
MRRLQKASIPPMSGHPGQPQLARTTAAARKPWKRIIKHNFCRARVFMKNSDRKPIITGKDFP